MSSTLAPPLRFEPEGRHALAWTAQMRGWLVLMAAFDVVGLGLAALGLRDLPRVLFALPVVLGLGLLLGICGIAFAYRVVRVRLLATQLELAEQSALGHLRLHAFAYARLRVRAGEALELAVDGGPCFTLMASDDGSTRAMLAELADAIAQRGAR